MSYYYSNEKLIYSVKLQLFLQVKFRWPEYNPEIVHSNDELLRHIHRHQFSKLPTYLCAIKGKIYHDASCSLTLFGWLLETGIIIINLTSIDEYFDENFC